MGVMRNAYKILVDKSEEKIRLGHLGVQERIIRIKIDLKETGYEEEKYIDVVHDRD
jgi:hypothetical protein